MFLLQTKTLLVNAVKRIFDANYPDSNMRDLWVSMEYPDEQSNYPGIWTDFTPVGPVQSAGIDHIEHSDPDTSGRVRTFRRWRYAGAATFTVVALSSFQRDSIADAMLAAIAFSSESPATSGFRAYIENNDLIEFNMQWDKVGLDGKAENPGTPWGTEEIVYEITLTVDLEGSFVSDGSTTALFPLSRVVVEPYREGDPDPWANLPQNVALDQWQ